MYKVAASNENLSKAVWDFGPSGKLLHDAWNYDSLEVYFITEERFVMIKGKHVNSSQWYQFYKLYPLHLNRFSKFLKVLNFIGIGTSNYFPFPVSI